MYYMRDKSTIRDLDSLFLNIDMIESLLQKKVPDYMKLWFRNTQPTDIFDQRYLQFLYDVLHWLFSKSRHMARFTKEVMVLVEFVVDKTSYRKRANECFKLLLVDQFEILTDVNKFDIGDDDPKTLFSERFENALIKYVRDKIDDVNVESYSQEKPKPGKQSTSAEPNLVNDIKISNMECKQALHNLIDIIKVVFTKMRSLLEMTNGRIHEHAEVAMKALDGDFVKLFDVFSYLLVKTIPHYELVEFFIYMELFLTRSIGSLHTPENCNSDVKYITKYHSQIWGGSISTDLFYVDLKSPEMRVSNNPVLQTLLGGFEKLTIRMDPDLFNILYFGDMNNVEVYTSDTWTKLGNRFDLSCFRSPVHRDTVRSESKKRKKIECVKSRAGLNVPKKIIRKYSKLPGGAKNLQLIQEFEEKLRNFFSFAKKISIFKKKLKIQLIQTGNRLWLPDALRSYFSKAQNEMADILFQREIHKHHQVFVVLPPGAGKTKVLCSHIQNLFDSHRRFQNSRNGLTVSSITVSPEWRSQYKDLNNQFNIKKHKIRLLSSEGEKADVMNLFQSMVDGHNDKEKTVHSGINLIITKSFLRALFTASNLPKSYSDFRDFLLSKTFGFLIVDEPQLFSPAEMDILMKMKFLRYFIIAATPIQNAFDEMIRYLKLMKVLDRFPGIDDSSVLNTVRKYLSTAHWNEVSTDQIRETLQKYQPEFKKLIIYQSASIVERPILARGFKIHKYVIVCKTSKQQNWFLQSIIGNSWSNFLTHHLIGTQVALGYYKTAIATIEKNMSTPSQQVKLNTDSIYNKYIITPAMRVTSNLVELFHKHEKKVVVFSSQTQLLAHTKNCLGITKTETIDQDKIETLDGRLSLPQRIKTNTKMKNGKNGIMLANNQVANCGINLTWADCIIQNGLSWSCEQDDQAFRRHIRNPTFHDCYVFVVVDDTELTPVKLELNIRKGHPMKIILGRDFLPNHQIRKIHQTFNSADMTDAFIKAIATEDRFQENIRNMYPYNYLHS